MPFTDDDLKRLKGYFNNTGGLFDSSPGKMKALIARLQAAENFLSHIDKTWLLSTEDDERLDTWKKVAGK